MKDESWSLFSSYSKYLTLQRHCYSFFFFFCEVFKRFPHVYSCLDAVYNVQRSKSIKMKEILQEFWSLRMFSSCYYSEHKCIWSGSRFELHFSAITVLWNKCIPSRVVKCCCHSINIFKCVCTYFYQLQSTPRESISRPLYSKTYYALLTKVTSPN